MSKSYKEYVESTLLPNYMEGLDLEKIEWLILNDNQLNSFLRENYICNDNGEVVSYYYNDVKEDECIFVGNIDESKNMDCNDIALGMKNIKLTSSEYNPYYGEITNSSKYLIGIVNNNIGKKTIVAQLNYRENFEGKTYANQIPYTKVYTAEINSYCEQEDITKKMMNVFVNIVDKDSPIIMEHCDDYADESEIDKNVKLFSILKQSAEEQGFSKTVFLNSCYDIDRFKEVVCPIKTTNKQLLKTRNI